MKILDLFAGIGGFSLAAHWMGWETAAFVEWDKDCHRVLQKNFPNVPIYGDIKKFKYEQERDRIGSIDLVCGGFPCQPFSAAGKRNGTDDDRYLWPEMLRTIQETKPRWVVGENVAGLVTMDGGAVFDEICTSLEAEGYQVEAFIIPACAVGAPHRRDRVWIVGNSISAGCETLRAQPERTGKKIRQHNWVTPHPDIDGHRRYNRSGENPGAPRTVQGSQEEWERVRREPVREGASTSHPNSAGPQGGEQRGTLRGRFAHESTAELPGAWSEHWLQAATRLCGMDARLPSWVDRHRTRRLKQLGNSIVPQVVYEIFRAIEEVENPPKIL